jgi:hypothetical protein
MEERLVTVVIDLLRRAAEQGVRFSLDHREGVLVANGEMLEPDTFEALCRHRDDIRDILLMARRQLVATSAGELAVLQAESIVRACAIPV